MLAAITYVTEQSKCLVLKKNIKDLLQNFAQKYEEKPWSVKLFLTLISGPQNPIWKI